MKIAINALSARAGGGIVYLNRLIYYLNKIDKKNEYYIFVTSQNRQKIISFKSSRYHIIEVRIQNLAHRLFYEQLIMSFKLNQIGADVIYGPAEILPLLTSNSTILGIQNPNIYYHIRIKRSFIEVLKIKVLKQLAKMSSKKAKRVIFVSKTSRNFIAEELKIPKNKTRAIYHGVEINKFQGTKFKESNISIYKGMNYGKYILCLSSLAPHKNIETLIEAYSFLSKNIKSKYNLVIAGSNNSLYGDKLKKLVRDLNLKNKVIFTGEISFDNVSFVYHKASVFVLPSYLETFGIPLIEAMASGIPVIASNTSAIPEVIGDSGLLFDPSNPNELKEKIEVLLQSSSLRKKLIKKGLARAKEFTWEKTAQNTLAVFEEVYRMKKQ